ncbi:PaaI family thioesterase [Henriciella sp.]|uniref:PaaI family thioesterase n=1 Tax=Henriciella sp. TaxID=1968823 RepID=UPI00260CD9B5|nr:PaaI family thioesterase [Henriciella sp.]
MTMTATDVPSGFERHFRTSPFTDPWEPLYSRQDPRKVMIGVRLREAHCNSRGLVHGGLIASLADNAMGLSAGAALRTEGRDTVKGLVTVSLTTDYLGPAKLGSWLEVDTHFVKTGGSLCFTDCLVLADGEPVARANASFKILK